MARRSASTPAAPASSPAPTSAAPSRNTRPKTARGLLPMATRMAISLDRWATR